MAYLPEAVHRTSPKHTVEKREAVESGLPWNEFILVDQIFGDIESDVVLEEVSSSQVEGVVDQLCPIDNVNNPMLGSQLLGDESPVAPIVVDSIVTHLLQVGYEPLLVAGDVPLTQLDPGCNASEHKSPLIPLLHLLSLTVVASHPQLSDGLPIRSILVS